ncbi:glycoside hydrolase family 88 protein [Devosia ginsengisoli]|nr:glycoside hydrolase family 88 protein [Devosia ginsengisoli]
MDRHDPYAAALARCIALLQRVSDIDGDRAPRLGNADLSWTYCPEHDWVASFRIGTLWLAYQETGRDYFRGRARARDAYYDRLLVTTDWHDHDLGFLFSLSCVADYRLTGREAARQRALGGARLLASRFVDNGGYLLAWDEKIAFDNNEKGEAWARFVKGRMIADTMQNLALLYWAAEQEGDPRLAEIATRHAQTAAQYLVRPDGSSFHTFAFDPRTGAPVGGATHQGYADASCWSRGQAWLIHGFAQTYALSGEAFSLEAARKVCARFEQLMGDDMVPVWDFDAPREDNMPVDSSAGAIAAAGYLLLASLVEGDERRRWHTMGLRLLDGLLQRCDLTDNPQAHGFLDEGAANVPKGRVRSMLPYGDYYLMEALMRAAGHHRFFW